LRPFSEESKRLKMLLQTPTKKAEQPPTRDVNRDSGTDSANGSGDFHEKAVK